MNSDYAPVPVEDFLDPDDPAMFPRLTHAQVDYLAEIGTQLTLARGDEVFVRSTTVSSSASLSSSRTVWAAARSSGWTRFAIRSSSTAPGA